MAVSSRLAAGLAVALLGVGAAAGLMSMRASAQTSLPGGSYINSCTNISIVGNVLEATCSTANQSTRQTALANAFNCSNGVMNSNGQLMCSNGGGGMPQPGPPPMQRTSGDPWESIAVSDDKGTKGGQGGWGTGEGPTKAAAESKAMSECQSGGGDDCSVELSFQGYGNCGAYASSKKYYGSGTGPSQAAASQAALNDCNDNSCKLLVAQCLNRN